MRAWLLGLLGLPVLLAGCGSDANRLYGSVKEAFGGLPFQRVEVHRQENPPGQLSAMHVKYLEDKGNIQVHVVANAPVAEGQEKDLVKDGGLWREVIPPSQFPEMKSGKLIFDILGDVGSTVSGRFYVTFKANPASGLTVEGTLNGDFSATLQKM